MAFEINVTLEGRNILRKLDEIDCRKTVGQAFRNKAKEL